MANSIIHLPKSLVGNMRYKVKCFKYREDMHKFLNDGSNSLKWRETKKDEPTKSGTYAFAGGQYINVRKLDASVLAHI